MKIAAVYSFNNGQEEVSHAYPDLLTEVNAAIKGVDASLYKTKKSKERTMPGRMLYSPGELNKAFKTEFLRFSDWHPVRVSCEYPTTFYLDDYRIRRSNKGAYREMDFVKNKLGVEIQFGKYSFMVYNVCAKMTIFRNLGHIEHGIEIVPVKAFAEEMSQRCFVF